MVLRQARMLVHDLLTKGEALWLHDPQTEAKFAAAMAAVGQGEA